MNKQKKSGSIILIALATLDVFVWYTIAFGASSAGPQFMMLDVGQGDSTLLVLPGNVKVMTDAGPDAAILRSLDAVMPQGDRYIDLAVISHPQLDHFNGFNELLGRYTFGAFIINGRAGETPEWRALADRLTRDNVPVLTLGAGDRIRHGESGIDILSPDATWRESGELNDTGLVERIHTPAFSALLTADTGMNIERVLAGRYDLSVDILKVGHHGSKYSSDDEFLRAVSPTIAVIGVGARNRYGHPTREALERLGHSSAKVFRTDMNGTIRIVPRNGVLTVFTER